MVERWRHKQVVKISDALAAAITHLDVSIGISRMDRDKFGDLEFRDFGKRRGFYGDAESETFTASAICAR